MRFVNRRWLRRGKMRVLASRREEVSSQMFCVSKSLMVQDMRQQVRTSELSGMMKEGRKEKS